MVVDATLIGRSTELETIERMLDSARAGASGVLVVRGVAGVGKTALLEHATDGATDFRVLRAEGVQSESELAFGGLHANPAARRPFVARAQACARQIDAFRMTVQTSFSSAFCQ